MSLVCRVCNDSDEIKRLAHALGHPRPPRCCSAGEFALVRAISEHPVAGQRREFVHEMKPWAGRNIAKPLAHVSADVVIFAGSVSTCTEVQRRGLIVFVDGKQHYPYVQGTSDPQVVLDREASRQAAALGYHVLRLHQTDGPIMLQVLDAAWAARDGLGWVKVSPCWNDGASRRTWYCDLSPYVPVMSSR